MTAGQSVLSLRKQCIASWCELRTSNKEHRAFPTWPRTKAFVQVLHQSLALGHVVAGNQTVSTSQNSLAQFALRPVPFECAVAPEGGQPTMGDR